MEVTRSHQQEERNGAAKRRHGSSSFRAKYDDGAERSSDSFRSATSNLSFNSARRIEGGQEGSSMVLLPPSQIGKRRSSFELDQLRFSKLSLHGRPKEQEILNECLGRVSGNSTHSVDPKASVKQLVLIRGESGTGKTALASSIQKTVLHKGGIFALGKYSLQQQSEPYVAVAWACRQICEAIAATKDDPTNKFNNFRKSLLRKLGDGIDLVKEVVPSLEDLIFLGATETKEDGSSVSTKSCNDGDRDKGNLLEAKARLHYVFRRFFRVITSHYSPLVIVLDDFQRTDAASVELIQDVISDRENRHIMFIIIYRSDEVNDEHILSKTMNDLKHKNVQKMFDLTEIDVDGIDIEALDGIITDLLSIDSTPATMALSQICHRRTRGNVFFIICFLRMLRENEYLNFNLGTFKWTWDISKIESETEVTINVVEFMTRKMKALESKFQTLLVLASCLGYSFEKRKLDVVAHNNAYGCDLSQQDIEEYLAAAVKEGFLEGPTGGDSFQYRWIHDNIQEAALSLVPAERLSKFKFDIGQRLLEESKGDNLDSRVFVVVELLNDYAIDGNLEESEASKVASLNMSAARKAVSLSAFTSASKFARTGISLLNFEHWTTQKDLALDLYSCVAQAEGSLGNRELMMEYSSEVTRQPHITLMEKMRVYRAQLESVGVGDKTRIREGVDLCLDLLDQFGCPLPRSNATQTFKLFLALMKHKRGITSRTLDEVLELPILDSDILREIDKILSELSLYAYMVGEMSLSGLCTMKQASITLKHGLHESSHAAFSSLAPFFMVAFNDLKGTARIAEYALRLKERAVGSKTVSGFNLLQGCFCAPFSQPWYVSLKLLLEGYESGMKAGELRNAIFCISTYVCGAYFAGKRLGPLLEDIETYYLQTEELHAAGYPLVILAMLRSCIYILTGVKPSGSESELDIMKDFQESDDFLVAMLNVFQGSIFYVFGDHRKNAALAEKSGILLDKLLSHSANMPSLYQQSLSLYISAQQTPKLMKRRRLKGLGMKRHKVLRKWASDGCCNVIHYVILLDAELSVLNREKKQKIQRLYQKAITLAVRGGFVQDAAVANERLAEYLMLQDDTVDAGRHFTQAIEYYEEWGFTEKSSALHERRNASIRHGVMLTSLPP